MSGSERAAALADAKTTCVSDDTMLRGRDCMLRPYDEADIPRLPITIGLPEVARWMSHRIPHPYSLDDARAWVATRRAAPQTNDFAIEVAGAFAGGIGHSPLEGEFAGTAEFGYWLAPAYWGRGIATDAARTFASYLFAERGLRRLQAWVFAENVASACVLERAGFTREGTMREGIVDRDGRVCDAVRFARLARDERRADEGAAAPSRGSNCSAKTRGTVANRS